MKKMISLTLALALVLALAACGSKPEQTPYVDVKALYEQSFSSHMPEVFFPDEVMLMDFLGIDVADCAQYQVAICAEGLRVDEVWLIEAKDEGALETLRQLAQTRIEAKLEETVSYVPDQYPIVEKAQVVTNGRYLALVISPEVDTLKAAFEAAFQ